MSEIEQMARTDPEIALRKIDIVNWERPVVRQYNIHSVPQVNVYNRGATLSAPLSAPTRQRLSVT